MIYRLKEAVPRRDDMPAGRLVFASRTSPDYLAGPALVTTQGDGYGRCAMVSRDKVEPMGDVKAADFEAYLSYILAGRGVLPNAVQIPTDSGVATIASAGSMECRPGSASVLLPDETRPTWARVFLTRTQAGALDGTGMAFTYKPTGVFAFKLCAHDIAEGGGANHSRGWHPASCRKCGLDLSVDSSD